MYIPIKKDPNKNAKIKKLNIKHKAQSRGKTMQLKTYSFSMVLICLFMSFYESQTPQNAKPIKHKRKFEYIQMR